MENITGGIVDSGSIAALLICLPMAYLAGAILSRIVQEGWKDRKVFEGSTSEGLRSAEGIVEEIAAHDSMGERVMECEKSYELGREHFWKGRSHTPPEVLAPGQKREWLLGWLDAEHSCHEYNENYGTKQMKPPKIDPAGTR